MKIQAVAVIGTGFIGTVHIEAIRRTGKLVRGVMAGSPASTSAAVTSGIAGKCRVTIQETTKVNTTPAIKTPVAANIPNRLLAIKKSMSGPSSSDNLSNGLSFFF